MTTEHTPEPWTTGSATESSNFGDWQARIRAKDSNGNVTVAKVLSGNGKEHDTKEVAEANARRIVACVNACAGISTETLDKRGVGGLDVSSAERLSFCQQRDALAEALHKIAEVCNGYGDEAGWACKHARAALGKLS
jgi:hypothetical protein